MIRPTRMRIDLDALEHNLRTIRELVGDPVHIWAVVKADAYGLGAPPIALHLERWGVHGFGVASCEEAIRLRSGGVTSPIIVLGGIYPGEGSVARLHRLTPVVYSERNLEETAVEARRAGTVFDVHLKINTGMNRLGIQPEDVGAAVAKLRETGNLNMTGVMSHLAESDIAFSEHTESQVARFQAVLDTLESLGALPREIHLANSAGIIASREGRGIFNGVRPGILLYGSVPDPALAGRVPVRPVVTLATRIRQLRRLGPGERISYGGIFVTRRESLIAVLPAGYADGLTRALSDKADFLIRGRRAPIAGRVCMDLTMVDVTDIPGVSVGDEAVLFGGQEDHSIGIEEVAAKAQTAPYEILTSINDRVPRIYERRPAGQDPAP